MSQEQTIIRHMKEHGSISFLEAFGVHRIFNLKGRIADLRGKGYKINTTMKIDDTGKRYAEYSLAEESTHAAA